MLTRLHLQNFKCFASLSLQLAPLTLLTGFNAAGKSTALQGLLLLAQSRSTVGHSGVLPLNGTYVRLGSPGDVVKDGGLEGNHMSVGVANDKWELSWELEPLDRSRGSSLRVAEVAARSDNGDVRKFDNMISMMDSIGKSSPSLEDLAQVSSRSIFISATRVGLADVFPVPDATPVRADVGACGEFAPWWFDKCADEDVDLARCHETEKARTVRRQFSAWAGTLFPGAQGNAQQIAGTSLVKLELRIGDVGDWRRPANIGYGLTYAFPILVAGLVAKQGQLLIVDSPEAHLHPAGQSAMGKFLACVAAAGVQVLVETHSDHVANGARLAVKDGKISPSHVLFQYFANSTESQTRRLETINVDAVGRMSSWPSGFFDQIERDLAAL